MVGFGSADAALENGAFGPEPDHTRLLLSMGRAKFFGLVGRG